MTKGKFADECKEEAVKQVIERGAVGYVAKRLSFSVQNLYKWFRTFITYKCLVKGGWLRGRTDKFFFLFP